MTGKAPGSESQGLTPCPPRKIGSGDIQTNTWRPIGSCRSPAFFGVNKSFAGTNCLVAGLKGMTW